ncbi:conserved hypothetical protein [Tenacibaculum sp. 190524A02b]|uniref:Lipoprotein n=1 Tax=Tenacibaculum vairaonense TaxID=3137860 RepID=A0ABP1F9R5_9FLAO
MRRILFILAIVGFFSCKNRIHKERTTTLNSWEQIKTAVIKNNIAFLIENSTDTLNCIECNNGNNKIAKKLFYNEHFNQMDVIKNKEYSFFTKDINNSKFNKKHKISYIINDKETMVYELLENTNTNKVIFLGVISIP